MLHAYECEEVLLWILPGRGGHSRAHMRVETLNIKSFTTIVRLGTPLISQRIGKT